MAIVTLVLEKPLGDQPEGSKIQVESDVAEALCSAGICREATADDLGDETPKEETPPQDNPPAEDRPVQEQLRQVARSLTADATKAVEKAAEKMRQEAEVKRPKIHAIPRDRTEEGKGGFKNLGEFVQVAIQKGRGDSSAMRAIERSKAMNMALAREKGSMSIAGSSGHAGGDLVPIEWAKDLWSLSFQHVPDLHGMCTQYPMEHQTLKIPLWVQSSATAGVTASVVAEGNLITDTTGVTATAQLDLVKFTALVNVTDELERFNAYALDTVLRTIVPQRIRYKSNDGIINGSDSQVNLIGNSSTTIVTRKTTGRIEYDDVLKMEAALFDDFDDAIWLVNNSTVPELYSIAFPSRAATTPIPAFTPGTFDNILGPRPRGELLGRAVYKVENVPTLGLLGDIILYSPKSIGAGTTGLIADVSPHLFFNYGENAYRFMWYADTVSLMNVPYTRKGGGTASNIIILSSASSSS